METREYDDILAFWFGDIANGDVVDDSKRSMWFNGTPELDQDITERFLTRYQQGLAGKLAHWQSEPKGSLALVVLLDQFPLNMFRRSARAFESEDAAVAACRHAIERHQDSELAFVERSFLYMPLMHAESADLQAASVQHYTKLVEDAPEPLRETAKYTLSFAQGHHDIVAKFGRFPHRNTVLARESTAEEIAFLNENPASYGQ